MNNYTLHVSGMHCPSCKILIEDVLSEQDFITEAHVQLKKEIVTITTHKEQNPVELAVLLTEKLTSNKYSFSVQKVILEKKDSNTIWQALPVGLIFLVLFFLLQKSGLLNFGIGGTTTPVTSFVIGLIASVSSCLAIVGGLVLSLSAKISQDDVDDKKNLVLFHTGRIAGFTLLGGLLGLLGSAIGVSFILSSILGLIAAIVMIFLGINLTGIITNQSVTLPSGIFKFFKKLNIKH